MIEEEGQVIEQPQFACRWNFFFTRMFWIRVTTSHSRTRH